MGKEDHFERVRLGEIVTQCRFALNAVHNLNAALRSLGEAPDQFSMPSEYAHDEVFRSLHSLLTHASNASKLLWPSPPRRNAGEGDEGYEQRKDRVAERARRTRAALDVGDDHVLHRRTLRNHLEHFDERLANWEESSERHNIVSDMIGPPSAVVGIEPTDRMRTFDPATNSFWFRGDQFDIQELATAVNALYQEASEKWQDQLRPAPPEIRQ